MSSVSVRSTVYTHGVRGRTTTTGRQLSAHTVTPRVNVISRLRRVVDKTPSTTENERRGRHGSSAVSRPTSPDDQPVPQRSRPLSLRRRDSILHTPITAVSTCTKSNTVGTRPHTVSSGLATRRTLLDDGTSSGASVVDTLISHAQKPTSICFNLLPCPSLL